MSRNTKLGMLPIEQTNRSADMEGMCDKHGCDKLARFEGYVGGLKAKSCEHHARELTGPLGEPMPLDIHGYPAITEGPQRVLYKARLVIKGSLMDTHPAYRTVFTDWQESLTAIEAAVGLFMLSDLFSSYQTLCFVGTDPSNWFKHPYSNSGT